ncbi:hypothetical protein B0H14DRAFT_2558175 [Mycena olivaceomarginata]|nr:hypothetical protein B0H14DRAFT_2558175 [Mycena olivaceomarginata]
MDTQLLREGWYPASQGRPQTCMTLVALEQFHTATCQAKTMMYNYYQTLVKLTSNDRTKPPDCYQVFIRICRYRHLMMLKRGGRRHDPGGARATQSDACFRLKRGLLSSELKDPGLGTGMAYMLENPEFREYLLTVTDQVEIYQMSTCSGLAALDYANTKFSRGYSSTGIGMGVYANIDYTFGSILRHHSPGLRKTISYDIVCQWWKHLMECLLLLPPLVRCAIVLGMIFFVIPKMHIEGHGIECGTLYSLKLIPGSGQTDGEGIERPWANIGGIASSTRIMGPGAHHNMIDDHWAYWNWQKLILLAATLRRKLDTALEQQVVQQEALDRFSLVQQDHIEGWKKMIHDFEEDPTLTNPYKVEFAEPENNKKLGLTEMDIRLQFQTEDEDTAKRGLPAKHKVSPGGFIVECLEVEEEQYVFLLHTWLQSTYCPAAVVVLEKRDVPEDEQPENEPLFLPSALSEAQRTAGCTPGLLEMELLMHDAQCRGSLVKLRNQLIIKARFLNYKSLHARHQGVTTHSQMIVDRNETKIRLHSKKYQAAWGALLAAAGGNVSQVGWHKLVREDIRCMEDPADLVMKEMKRKKAKERRKRKYDELLAHGVDVPAWDRNQEEDSDGGGDEAVGRKATESQREVSWIWMGARNTGSDAGFENGCAAFRIEWSKVYARSQRCDKEVMLLTEEFRRLPISLEFEAERWMERSQGLEARSELEEVYMQGMRAYAAQQEVLFRDLADRARAIEAAPKLAKGKGRVRTRVVDPLQDTEAPASDGENRDDDAVILAAVRDDDTEEERGVVESDEEVIMGGKLDDYIAPILGVESKCGKHPGDAGQSRGDDQTVKKGIIYAQDHLSRDVSCTHGWRKCRDAVGAEESDREFTVEHGRECCENLGHCGGVFATQDMDRTTRAEMFQVNHGNLSLAEVKNPGQSCSCHSKIEPAAEKGNNIKKNFGVGGVQQKATVGKDNIQSKEILGIMKVDPRGSGQEGTTFQICPLCKAQGVLTTRKTLYTCPGGDQVLLGGGPLSILFKRLPRAGYSVLPYGRLLRTLDICEI